MKHLFYLFLSLIFLQASGQHINGLYSGTIKNDSLKMTQNYELALSEYKGKITGYSYITFVKNDTFYYGIKRVKAMRENNELIVNDVEMLMNNYPQRPDKGVHLVNIFSLTTQDTMQNLSGTWKTTESKKHGFYSIAGNLSLTRDADSAHSSLINHLKELKLLQDPSYYAQGLAKTGKKEQAELVKHAAVKEITSINNDAPQKADVAFIPFEKRRENLIETVNVSSDSLVLSFYDNGVVDGDTISVYLNNEKIISRVRLTEVAARKIVDTKPLAEDDYKLTLVAENLGSIPPNTGLVMIQDGAQRYQIRFSADLQTNAAILIRRKK